MKDQESLPASASPEIGKREPENARPTQAEVQTQFELWQTQQDARRLIEMGYHHAGH